MQNKSKYINQLNRLKETGCFRSFPEFDSGAMLNLSSNDYLGLMSDNSLTEEFINNYNIKESKFSASSSRLLSGNSREYNYTEKLIAASYNRESCLIFNSGYHANIGILPALAQKNDLIIADKLVHASIIDGMQLSKADFLRYNHLDYVHLNNLLEKKGKNYKNIFIVSESIFSMDGDKADIEKLVIIKNKYKAFLYLDEAHAVGAVGKTGLGCAEEKGFINEVDFIIGTFGKALASVGAYVICDEVFKQYLINHARTLIFTTAMPPINLAWTAFIFEKLPDFNERRIKLKAISQQFANLIEVNSESHIIPFVIGENNAVVEVSNKLKQAGFNVLPIRYPTVPKGTARLRFSLNATPELNQLLPVKEILKV